MFPIINYSVYQINQNHLNLIRKTTTIETEKQNKEQQHKLKKLHNQTNLLSSNPNMSILPPLISSPKPLLSLQQNPPKTHETKITKKIHNCNTFYNKKAMSVLMAGGFAFTAPLFMDIGSADALELPLLVGSALELVEPTNALSLPTWAIHVSSVAEWVAAMILVWQYGEKSGYKSWKGLSWGATARRSVLCLYLAFLL
ncbi:hypothetical protein CTI12_AA539560 [Artemisia annua]|uniref:Uncharacterized protein n=1 Tax=Artemisia annua TaxID=35608 RepID=A0A2U1L246_ARTAN|nr:hypothetical protein CTI12_AA539560 [Artemisia annua]